MPQNRFASIHVVGTNGKTSVTRMTAGLLEAGGVGAGAYLAPHIVSWRERILIRGGRSPSGPWTQHWSAPSSRHRPPTAPPARRGQ